MGVTEVPVPTDDRRRLDVARRWRVEHAGRVYVVEEKADPLAPRVADPAACLRAFLAERAGGRVVDERPGE